MELQIENRFWIKTSDGTIMGEGRATLLEHIDQTGSIKDAAQKMDMPLEKANKLVEVMNSASPELVLNLDNSPVTLTDYARRLIRSYRRIQTESREQMNSSLQSNMG